MNRKFNRQVGLASNNDGDLFADCMQTLYTTHCIRKVTITCYSKAADRKLTVYVAAIDRNYRIKTVGYRHYNLRNTSIKQTVFIFASVCITDFNLPGDTVAPLFR